MEWKPEVWVAIYAAVVSTSAMLIQVRAWATSGARLSVSLIPDGVVFGGDPQFDESGIVIINATNVGTSNTMIIGLTVEERYPLYYFWRRRPIKAYSIPNLQLKGYPANTPQILAPAHTWTGAVRQRLDIVPNLRDGDHYASVHTSTRRRPYRRRIIPQLPKATAQ